MRTAASKYLKTKYGLNSGDYVISAVYSDSVYFYEDEEQFSIENIEYNKKIKEG